MANEQRTAIAIVLAALVVSATLIWCTLRIVGALESSAANVPTTSPVTKTPAQTPATGMPPPASAQATEQQPALTQAEFSEAWRGERRAMAERECFAPVDARGDAIEPKPYFTVTVAADGRVESVQFDEGRRELFGDLFSCVASHVKQVVLSPGERRTGRVQAEREPPPE